VVFARSKEDAPPTKEVKTMRTRTLALVSAATLLATSAAALAVTTDGPEDLEALTGAEVVETDEVVPSIRDRVRDRDGTCVEDGEPDRDRNRDRDGSEVTASERLRDGQQPRDRDGSCDASEQVQARTQQRERTYEHNRTHERIPERAGAPRHARAGW
jgi:hypothetical protein